MSLPTVDARPALSVAAREQKLKTSFATQAGALMRKNASQQRRALRANILIILTPIFFVVLLYVLQLLIDRAIATDDNRCGCRCLRCCDAAGLCRDATPEAPCRAWEDCEEEDASECGVEFSSAEQARWCAVESPSAWPALLQVPPGYALAEAYAPAGAVLLTGADVPALSAELDLFPDPVVTPAAQASAAAFAELGAASGAVYAAALSLLGVQLGTDQIDDLYSYQVEPGFVPNPPDYNGTLSLLAANASAPATLEALGAVTAALAAAAEAATGATPGAAAAVAGLALAPLAVAPVWLASADDVNSQLYCGYADARCEGVSVTNAYINAYDFGASDPAAGNFSTRLWYNATGRYPGGGQAPLTLVRVHGALNAAAGALLRAALGPAARARLAGVMAVPKPATELKLAIATLIGVLFFTWLLQLLLPTMLAALVAEREHRLRAMMKMHGLGDAAYWAIQYAWWFAFNTLYVWVLVGAGSAIRLPFFTATSYSLQLVLYALWVACLLSFTFLLSTLFRSARTATAAAFIYVFASGLIGYLLLQNFVAADKWWVVFMELVPGLGLYRALYEIAEYAFRAAYTGGPGLTWARLADPGCGVRAVMIIFAVEAVVFLLLAWYVEQVAPGAAGVARHPLFFLGCKPASEVGSGKRGGGWLSCFGRRKGKAGGGADAHADGANADGTSADGVAVGVAPPDVAEEAARAEALWAAAGGDPKALPDEAAVLVRGLRKVYPGGKVAVRELTLAVARGECFGLLGPNGAGKSTTLGMLTGFLAASGGAAAVCGHDLRADVGAAHGAMGVCPQDNLLWERLTAREHLLFYGRLKNLAGAALTSAVEAGLRSVNLASAADRPVGGFSGGMKRRLSVAISLIGDPLVVYLDEPSTGLDPASRHTLWEVVRGAKRGRGVILTTHSMEEAAVLCDRLGIFVAGELVCVGSPRELTARHGGYLVLSLTTAPGAAAGAAADALAARLAPGARRTHALGGARRYELPAGETSLAAVFEEMERVGAAAAAGRDGALEVLDWGIANATLEEVFIKFARSINAEGGG